MIVALDETHDPARSSWISGAKAHADFPVQNLPLGIFSPANGYRRPGVAIGDFILDLRAVASFFPKGVIDALKGDTLNLVMGLPAAARSELRRTLSHILSDPVFQSQIDQHLHRAVECTMHLPAAIADYTDFYVGIHHATNVGLQFRPDNPLLPNYKYVPIGYHGRASSVRVSGVPVIRPSGQRKNAFQQAPVYEPTQRLDYELELGVWVGEGNALGTTIPIGDAGAHIAGLCLLNDWSARDFQAWEYQPLGPFLAKNFHTTISPWMVTAEALAPFRIAQAARTTGDPAPLPYLWDDADQAAGAFAIEMQVSLSSAAMRSAGMPPLRLAESRASHMYWTVAQMLAHHASNGCGLNPGDLLGSGTISAPNDQGLGSLLELTLGGGRRIPLPDGSTRAFLEDGDEIILTGQARREGHVSIGFGACTARIVG